MLRVRWWFPVLLLLGCSAVIRLPSQGGPAWFEVRSEHFTLWTDATPERGQEIVREMERRRQVILAAMRNPGSRTRTFVIALRDRLEADEYLRVNSEAMAWDADNPTGQPGILMAADDGNRRIVANHEMAHVFSFEVVAHQPRWLSEGIAQYFEAFALSADRTEVRLGVPRGDRLYFLSTRYPLPTADLFSCKVGCGDSQFYATSWAVFSVLLNHHYAQFVRFLHLLDELYDGSDDWPWYKLSDTLPAAERDRRIDQRRQRRRDREARAWREAFPDLPPDELDREVRDWLVSGKIRLPSVTVTLRDFPGTARRLGEADVLALRSWLELWFVDDMDAAQRDVDGALAVDRSNVLARLIKAALTQSITPDEARATAAAHPDDWRAQRLVMLASQGTAAADEALDRLCAMSANTAMECAHRRVPPATPSASSDR